MNLDAFLMVLVKKINKKKKEYREIKYKKTKHSSDQWRRSVTFTGSRFESEKRAWNLHHSDSESRLTGPFIPSTQITFFPHYRYSQCFLCCNSSPSSFTSSSSLLFPQPQLRIMRTQQSEPWRLSPGTLFTNLPPMSSQTPLLLSPLMLIP